MKNPEKEQEEVGFDLATERSERSDAFRNFLAEQIVLPPEDWSAEFKAYVERRYEQDHQDIPEQAPEEIRERILQRYIKSLDLREEDLKDKRILDLGCGEEGEFVRELLDRHITSEAYGLDAQIQQEALADEYREHLHRGNFEQEFPGEDYDYIVSMGALEAPSEERGQENPEQTLHLALQALKEDGEIKVYPIRKPSQQGYMPGLEYSEKRWEEILKHLSSNKDIEWELKPMEIKVAGKNRDVWLEQLLIIRKASKEE